MSLNPLTLVEKLINEHGSAAIQEERLVLLREQLEQLQKEHDRLQQENQTLKAKVYDLEQELEAKTVPDEFTKHRGILLKRNADGKIDPDAYCPTCKIPMSSLGGELPFKCSKCKFIANLNGRELRISLGETGLELV